MKEFLNNKWFKFGLWAVLYTLWVIWLGSYFWLLGLVVIFDNNITKKVKWQFWKKDYKEGEKKNVFYEWMDALIFGLIVVPFINIFFIQSYVIPTSSMERTLMTGDYLFVSKLAFGTRVPQRPLSLPFMHNTTPLGGKSYSDLIKLDYKRLKGFSEVKREDIVVFSWPHGDTVLKKAPMDDYYESVRMSGKEYTVRNYGPIITRPIDKIDNYVKRCVAVGGDSLQIKDGYVYVNGIKKDSYSSLEFTYTVQTNGTAINPIVLDKLGVNPRFTYFNSNLPGYEQITLDQEAAEKIAALPNVVSCERIIDNYPPDYPDSYLRIFPYVQDTKWTRDNYGPIYIPAKGDEIALTLENLPLYERLITTYQGDKLEVKEGQIYINGELTDIYTITQDYYFMMGDNRHNSLDSRYWGFVPETHIVGKPKVIWFSSDKDRSFPRNIRWDRILNFI